MDVDNRSSLGWHKMIHGPGVDDWTWGRWYWCQPTALELGLWTAYGSPTWETEVGTRFIGPQYLIQPGPRKEGSLAEDARPMPDHKLSEYAVSRVSPFPGLNYHGEPDWYENGLPQSELWPDEDVRRCNALVWQTVGDFDVDVDMDEVGGFLDMDGGGEGGGDMADTHVCPFPYGSCLIMEGGAEGGGEFDEGGGAAFLMDGGGEAGGEWDEMGTTGMTMEGGGEGGGEFDMAEVMGDVLEGGGEGGDDMLMGPAPYHTGTVTSPYLVASPTVTLAIPAWVVGDITYAIGVVPSETVTVTTPPGWTLLVTGVHPGTIQYTYWLWYIVHEFGDSPNVTFELSGSIFSQFALVTYDFGEPPSAVVVDFGQSTTPTSPGITVPEDEISTVVVAFVTSQGDLALTTPTDFHKISPASGNARVSVFDSHNQFGPTGVIASTIPNGRYWVSLCWSMGLGSIEPPPPPPPPPPP